MTSRPLLTALIAAPLLATTLAAAAPAFAAPTASGPSTTAAADAPQFLSANGSSVSWLGGEFDATLTPTTIKLVATTDGVDDATVEIFATKSHKTLCEAHQKNAPAKGAIRAYFTCVITEPLDYGATEVAAVVHSAGGSITSSESNHYDAVRVYGDSTVDLDSYDPSTKTAHVSGRSLASADFTVTSKYAGAGSGPADTVTRGTVGLDGRWAAAIKGVERPSKLTLRLPDIHLASSKFIFVPEDGQLPSPEVEATLDSHGVRIHVTGPSGVSFIVRDSDGQGITGGGISNGQTSSDVWINDPLVERRYSVVLGKAGQESVPVPFTVRAGEGVATTAAPRVESAQAESARVVATIAGLPGAIVRVSDGSRKTVAIKSVGSDGKTTVMFSAGLSGATAAFTVTQSLMGSTSEAVALTPTAG